MEVWRLEISFCPNIIDESVPIGKDDSENVEIEKFGEPKVADFEIPYHADILDTINFFLMFSLTFSLSVLIKLMSIMFFSFYFRDKKIPKK